MGETKETEAITLSMDEVRKIVLKNKVKLLDDLLINLDKRKQLIEGELNKTVGAIAAFNDIIKLSSQLNMPDELLDDLRKRIETLKRQTSEKHIVAKGKLEMVNILLKDYEEDLNQILALPSHKKVGFGKNKEKKKTKKKSKDVEKS